MLNNIFMWQANIVMSIINVIYLNEYIKSKFMRLCDYNAHRPCCVLFAVCIVQIGKERHFNAFCSHFFEKIKITAIFLDRNENSVFFFERKISNFSFSFIFILLFSNFQFFYRIFWIKLNDFLIVNLSFLNHMNCCISIKDEDVLRGHISNKRCKSPKTAWEFAANCNARCMFIHAG